MVSCRVIIIVGQCGTCGCKSLGTVQSGELLQWHLHHDSSVTNIVRSSAVLLFYYYYYYYCHCCAMTPALHSWPPSVHWLFGTLCPATSAHSKTLAPLNRAWKLGCFLGTSIRSTLETFVTIALYKLTYTIPYYCYCRTLRVMCGSTRQTQQTTSVVIDRRWRRQCGELKVLQMTENE